jgi:uncharacterized membrane protein YfcA
MPYAGSTRAQSARTGFLAGILNGLIGIGGGIVIVPALLARGATPQQAVGTSLAAVVVLSTIAFVPHAFITGVTLGGIGFAAVVVSGIAGALAGAWILARLTPRRMLLLFAVLVFALSARLVLQGIGIASLQPMWPGEPTLSGYLCVGLASGVLSGVFGVGGGALVVLGLAVLFGMSVHDGLPIALAVNVTNAIAGAARHGLAGRIRRSDVLAMIPAAIGGIAIGAAVALWLPPDALRVVFGGFFCFMGVRMARQGLRR